MNKISLTLVAVLSLVSMHLSAQTDRAAELLSRMTLEEKCDYIGSARSFVIRSVPRLGIPEIRMADGPQGIRNNTVSTLYPCGILTAATWNRELAEELGHGLGSDAKARGVSILLGPGVNIYRAPMCGRNFEYFGEDPYLSSEVAKHYIIGVQDEGVIATIKHFAANNQEWNRHHASSDVDERTMHEIYFPAFKKAVQEAHVGAVMNSYNLVNNVHASENAWMNIDVLRNMWGFDGILMSDWTSVYSSSAAANGGLDLECPKGIYFTAEKLVPLVEAGIVREEDIDRKVYNILSTLERFGLLEGNIKDETIPLDNPKSDDVALRLAREGVVLLENRQSELPFNKRDRVLVLGPNATVVTTGGGSGFVTPFHTTTLADGLCALKKSLKSVSVLSDAELYPDCSSLVHCVSNPSVQGFDATFFNNKTLEGPAEVSRVDKDIDFEWKRQSPDPKISNDSFSCRWEGVFVPQTSGTVRFNMAGDDGYRLFVDDVKLGGDWGNHAISTRTVFFKVEAGREYRLRFEFYDNLSDATARCKMGFFDEAALMAALKTATRVVFCGGFDSDIEGEGFDRPFSLPSAQVELINKLTASHDHVTVVLNAGGAVDFNGWSENAEAVLMAWYSGQEGGKALAEILSGACSPSGKLPVSMENVWEDNPVNATYYDNTPVRTQGQPYKRVEYREGIFVGYRGYDRSGKTPRYPFGYGLSYTSFSYSDLQLTKMADDCLKVSFKVTNTGRFDASETAQVYVRDIESSVPRPAKELKGYQKIFIPKGGSANYEVVLNADAFSFYDVKSKSFVLEPGAFEIMVGGSSADLPLKASVNMGVPVYSELAVEPDRTSVIRNPLNGWVMYLGRNFDENFWTERGYDRIPVGDGSTTARVWDYCGGTTYIRTSWASMEPEEGRYFWDDPDSRLNKLLLSVREKGLKLAFRIVVDGRDQGQNTPMYVINAGAECFSAKVGDREVLTPYPDDPVFQEKYAKFITALAERFNNYDEVDFIDAYGLGKWGEAHSMKYKDEANKIPVFEWITDLYSQTFTKVPLIINYHRVLAVQHVNGWEDLPNPDSEPMLESCIRKGYSLRHDAFGMTGYYQQWERDFAAKWNYKLPIIFEGGWITGAHHRYWIDPSKRYREGHPEDVRRGEMDDAEQAHVNMMDFRVGNETESWFQNIEMVQEFVEKGGYRLYPSLLKFPTVAVSGTKAQICHTWENLGWGYCPNNIPQWNYRFKPAFALADKDGRIVKTFVDTDAEPSTWFKGAASSYELQVVLDGLAAGEYTWLVGIVDTQSDNKPGINLSVPASCVVDGWMKAGKLNIK
ncbi:MAG: glycoside hydrolase family 3 C-terminal domain-containing protein [Bacteroidales bacterium]|nr:glycoside hydrolase family 3 C-terminal domain-containing protein [Bacteroidales bacterium]